MQAAIRYTYKPGSHSDFDTDDYSGWYLLAGIDI